MIALAGLPGAGKSTVAARVCEEVNARFGPNAMVALGMDGFHLTRAQLKELPDPEQALVRRGAPWTFDLPALIQRLRAIHEAAGHRAVPWPDFHHDVGDPVDAAFTVSPQTRLVLVEGLYLLHEADGWSAAGRLFDERWYLDAPLATAMDRLARRHMGAWGLSRKDAEARIAANDRLNAEIVLESRTNADWVLSVEAR